MFLFSFCSLLFLLRFLSTKAQAEQERATAEKERAEVERVRQEASDLAYNRV